MSLDHLVELERSVTEKFTVKAAERAPDSDLNVTGWLQTVSEAMQVPIDPNIPQFPREQWVSYPARRTVVLILCNRMLDFDLDDAQWTQLCWLMQYGGKERVA